MTATQRQRLGIVGLGLAFEGGLAVLAVLLGWLLDEPAAATWQWQADAVLLGLIASLPMLAGFFVSVRWPVGPLARIQAFMDEVVRPLFAPCSLLELGLISLAAGVGEELLFRGVVQPVLAQPFGPLLGLLAASGVFGLCHLITPTYGVLAALLGVYLGVWWLATENLLVVVVAHAFYDWVALIYLVRYRGADA